MESIGSFHSIFKRRGVLNGQGVARLGKQIYPESNCPYCTSDNKAVREIYFDQTCADCVHRMIHGVSKANEA